MKKMEEDTRKPSGKVFAEVGHLLVQYEGPIEETPQVLRIFDLKLQRTIDIRQGAVKQIIWQGQPVACQKEQLGAVQSARGAGE